MKYSMKYTFFYRYDTAVVERNNDILNVYIRYQMVLSLFHDIDISTYHR